MPSEPPDRPGGASTAVVLLIGVVVVLVLLRLIRWVVGLVFNAVLLAAVLGLLYVVVRNVVAGGRR